MAALTSLTATYGAAMGLRKDGRRMMTSSMLRAMTVEASQISYRDNSSSSCDSSSSGCDGGDDGGGYGGD